MEKNAKDKARKSPLRDSEGLRVVGTPKEEPEEEEATIPAPPPPADESEATRNERKYKEWMKNR